MQGLALGRIRVSARCPLNGHLDQWGRGLERGILGLAAIGFAVSILFASTSATRRGGTFLHVRAWSPVGEVGLLGACLSTLHELH